MDNFLKYFAQDIGNIFHGFLNIFKSIFDFFVSIFDIKSRMEAIERNGAEFTLVEWILFIASNLILLAIIVLLVVLAVKYGRKLFRFRAPIKKLDESENKIKELQRELIKMTYEKDRILSMKLGGLDKGNPGADANGTVGTNRNTIDSPCVDPASSRFFRLTAVDNYYKEVYAAPEYDNEITLEQFCDKFRAYAASELHLYYDTKLIRHFVS